MFRTPRSEVQAFNVHAPRFLASPSRRYRRAVKASPLLGLGLEPDEERALLLVTQPADVDPWTTDASFNNVPQASTTGSGPTADRPDFTAPGRRPD
jgi:hypothetical protein